MIGLIRTTFRTLIPAAAIMLVLVLASCQQRLLLNPIDPGARNYIGSVSVDADGDGIGQWEDVDEIAAVNPQDGSIVSTVSPTLTLAMFNPDIVRQYRFQVSNDPSFAPGSIVWDHSDTSTNSLTLPLGYLENNRQYFWRAKAHDGEAWSARWSEVRSFAVHVRVAGLGGLTFSRDPADGGLTLSWAKDSEAAEYQVEMARSQAFSAEDVVLKVTNLTSPSLPLDVVLESGITYYWRVRSERPGGILGAWSGLSSFTVDSSSLPIDAATPTDGAVVISTNPTLSWPKTEGAVAYEVQLSESPDFTPLAVSTQIDSAEAEHTPTSPLATDHRYYWRVRAQTGDQVWGPWSPTWRFSVNDTPMELLSPAGNAVFPPGSGVLRWNSHSAAVRYLVQISTSLSFDPIVFGIEVGGTDLDLNGYIADEAVYYWRTAVIDETGRSGGVSTPRAFTLDAGASALPKLFAPTVTNDPTPLWTWTLPVGATEVQVKLNGGSWQTPENPLATSYTPDAPLEDGVHALSVQSQGGDAMWSSEVVHALTVDTVAPVTPEVTGPSSSASDRPTWTIALPDGAAGADRSLFVRYQLSTMDPTRWDTVQTVLPFSYTPAANLTNGSHSLAVQLGDPAGNWSQTASHTISVDMVAPEGPVVSGPDISTDPRPTWTWTLAQDAVEARYQLGGTAADAWVHVSVGTTSYTPDSELAEGSHTLYVESSDEVGNWSPAGSHTVLVDRPAPFAPSLSLDTVSPTTDARPTWTISTAVAGTGTIRYRLSSAASDSWTEVPARNLWAFTPPTPLADGSHTLEAQVADAPGNWSETTELEVTVDATPPAPLEIDGFEKTWKPRPTWFYRVEGGGSPTGIVEVRYDIRSEALGGVWSTTTNTVVGSFTPPYPLPQGRTEVSVKARDSAGNWSEPVQFETTVDSTTIGLEWDHSPNWEADDVLGYRVYFWGTTGWELLQTVPAEPGTPAATVTGLEIGRTYEFMVTAYTSYLESGYSETLVYIPGQTNE